MAKPAKDGGTAVEDAAGGPTTLLPSPENRAESDMEALSCGGSVVVVVVVGVGVVVVVVVVVLSSASSSSRMLEPLN